MKKQVISIERIKPSGQKGELFNLFRLMESVFSEIKIYKID
jgi:hypothetical protein